MSIVKILALVIVTTLCTSVICQTPAKLLCGSKETCRDCLQVKECAWCREESYGRDRCFHPSLSSQVQCNEEFVYNPNNTAFALEDRLLSRTSGSSGGLVGASGSHSSAFGESSGGIEDVVQISPQKVQLKLRINQAHRINVNYAQAKEYPVDLYYLMDLSKSMEDDKIKLTTLGNTLSAVMKNITSDFRLGFGSFVDKVLMPYVSTVPKKLEQPCSNCTAPYGFKNNMPLNIDTEKFSTEVEHAEVSGNLDAPEGGFDAIMQAVVCRQQIGWREKARRLLVFSTDAGFHYAGDGKLGGVITPNDGKCHLDSEGMYSHSTIQDYPSISQINLKVKQNAINVIFAVVQEQHHVYQKLSEHVEGSSSRVLSTDSSNIVQLVKEEYSKISSSVEMKDNSTNAVKITYYSSCLKGGPLLPTNKCEGLKVGDVVKFEAEIVVTSCPQNRNDWHQMFQIYPVGINESLIIDLEMLCSCPCEEVGEFYSESCNTHGTYKCGICECDDSYFGKKCECSNTEIQSKSEKDLGCRHDNTTQVDCSGRGNCVCGVCECNRHQNGQERFSGKYCECDNHSCDHYNDLICSGSEHGECSCGVCMCRPGWGGSACECRQSNDTCIAPNNTEICSGRGECECGTCKCSSTDETRYSGKYCEKCPTCLGRCPEFRDCVECQMYNVGRLEEEGLCAENCTLFVPIPVDEVKPDLEQNERYCTFYDKYDCRYSFVYSEENNKVTVRAQEERECPPKVFMLGVVLGVIAAIVLIGLAILLLWKLLTSIHDRREFARFEKERMMAKWDTGENPIYKQATSTFKNPTYAGK